MPRDKRVVESGLQAKGFVRDERHQHYFIFHTAKCLRTRVKTKTSHGGARKMKSIPDALLAQRARQCHLARAQFLDLVDCPMDRDQYETVLRAKGLL